MNAVRQACSFHATIPSSNLRVRFRMHTFCRSAAFTLLVFTASVAHATKNPWVSPQSIVINFVHGNRAVFEIYEEKIAKIVVYVGVPQSWVPRAFATRVQV